MLVPHQAREIRRIHIDRADIIRMVRVLVPVLCPRIYHGTGLIGRPFTAAIPSPLIGDFSACLDAARRSTLPQRHYWESSFTGRRRTGIFVASERQRVMLSVFADHEEAARFDRRVNERRSLDYADPEE